MHCHEQILVVLTLASACSSKKAAPRATGDVVALRVIGELPRADAASAAWATVDPVTVALLPQDLVEPRLMQSGVGELEVRALHDDAWIAFRIEWKDATRDALVGAGRFSDAVAIQLPVGSGPDATDPAMGIAGQPVAITVWKAAWQERGDPVAALRPNMPPYHYPYEAATGGDRAVLERLYAPARGAGNPVTARDSDVAVQDLRAEGAGTITAVPRVSTGQGSWSTGHWRVVIARPLAIDPQSAPLRADRRANVAFAVWDGSLGHVGAKKMRTVWLPLRFEVSR